MIHVPDTHALVWFLEGNSRLSAEARLAMESPDTEVVIPAIVLAEVAFPFGRNRIGIDLRTVLEHVSGAENCTIYPLDEAVVMRLPVELNIHDGLIVATALVFRDVLKKDVAIITKDSEIRRSSIIQTVW
jgi:PIN domain nuclease of toxin-antitoxin system